MAHTQHDRRRIVARINRIRGQLDGAVKLVEANGDCYRVMQVLASCRGALNGLMGEVVEGHIVTHIVDAESRQAAARAGREVTGILRSFWK